MNLTRENYEELLAARALGALSEAEERDLDDALAGDAGLRVLARELDEAAAMLAFATEPLPPPAGMRADIIQAVRIPAAGPRTIQEPENELPENVVPFPRRAKSGGSAWRFRAAAIAAVIVIAVLAGGVWIMWRRSTRQAADLARMNRRTEHLEQQVTHDRELREMLSNPDASVVALTGTAVAPAANAKFIYDHRTGRALLMTDKLPVAPSGKAYQLWYIVAGKPIPGDVFKPDAGGRAEMKAEVPPEGRANATFAVTLETDGGTSAPQGQMYLKGAEAEKS